MDAATAHSRLNKAASAFLAGKHKLLIDGKWVDSKSGKTFDVFDPATGQMIAKVAEADAADVELAVAAARRARRSPCPRPATITSTPCASPSASSGRSSPGTSR
jgi:hypothetical protein